MTEESAQSEPSKDLRRRAPVARDRWPFLGISGLSAVNRCRTRAIVGPSPDARARASMRYDGKVTFVDRLYQLAYKIGYQLVRLLWIILRPTTHGALIVVWKEGSLLLVRNSYVPHYSPPGGYVRGGETTLQAAVRELKEETGLEVKPSELRLCHEETHNWEFRRDHVTMYDLEIHEPCHVEVDHREVVSAGFYTPQEALKLPLFPPLRRRIEKHLAEIQAKDSPVESTN